ncbi:MAG: hypothetical protein EOR60_15220 [Mesorhizobium sp.]|nr:MAG: hypothetical protein EOR60_15220 [Mesorhizobium sp.]
MVKGLILAAIIASAGCTTTKGGFCAVAGPQRPSVAAVDAMTDAQVKALLAHNRTGQQLCGWKP